VLVKYTVMKRHATSNITNVNITRAHTFVTKLCKIKYQKSKQQHKMYKLSNNFKQSK